MNTIRINGTDLTGWASGLDDLSEAYSWKDDGSIELGQSSQITIRGEGYNYLYDLIYNNSCTSINSEYEVNIRVGSCNNILNYVLRAQGVALDPQSCTAKLNLNVRDERDEQVRRLAESYFWDPDFGFIASAAAKDRIPKLLCVNQLDAFSKVVAIWIILVLQPIAVLIRLMIKFINAIIDFINTLGADIDNLDDKFIEYTEDDILGAGEFTTVYYIKDIIEHWASHAGLRFVSSIWQNYPYSEVALFSRQNSEGYEIGDCSGVVFDEANAANYNAIEIITLLNPLFNTEWRIIGDTLFIESKDFFPTTASPIMNLDQEQKKGNIIGGYEYLFDNTINCARFIGEYSQDSIDTQGNRAIPFYRVYKDYNTGLIHANRRGDCRPDIQFAPLRCTEDKWKDAYMSFFWKTFGSTEFTHAIVLTQTLAQREKLLCIDRKHDRLINGCTFSYVCRDQLSPAAGDVGEDVPDLTGEYEYNTPLWMAEIYAKFHAQDGPDNNQRRFVQIPTIKWRPDNFCAAVQTIHENKLNILIGTRNGHGIIRGGLTINYGLCTIEFNDIRFKCQQT